MGMRNRILVVDDEQDICEMLRDVLEMKDYVVDFATSGEEAVAIAQASQFDAAIVDVRMAGMDGVETARLLRAANPGIAIIIISGFAEEDKINRALNEGALIAFPKPINFDSLFKTLSDALKG